MREFLEGEIKHGLELQRYLMVLYGFLEKTKMKALAVQSRKTKRKWQLAILKSSFSTIDAAMEKDEYTNLSMVETKVYMYDIKTGKTKNIYEKRVEI